VPDNQEREYTDVSNVEKMRNFLTSEEMPEGAYGSPINVDDPVENKSTPWREGQRYYTPSSYENRSLHQGMPRQMEGAHPTDDDPSQEQEAPYQDIPPNNI